MLRCLFILCMCWSFPTTGWASDPIDVKAWNDLALSSIRSQKIPPPMAARYLAALHLAIFEVINSSSGRYRSMIGVAPQTDPALARYQRVCAAAAARRLLSTFASADATEKMNSMYELEDGLTAESPEKTAAIELGIHVSESFILSHLGESGKDPPGVVGEPQAGQWQPTPPAKAPYLLPGWGLSRTWLLPSGQTVNAPGPPALNSHEYLGSLGEVRRIGSKTSNERTSDQTEAAFFWADGAGTATPPGHWNTILSENLQSCSNDAVDMSRIYAVLNMALADASIAAWNAKWNFYFWRPITAIAEQDPDWEPLLETPPFPSYVSGHAAFSGAAATVLESFFGTKVPTIWVSSETLPSIVRIYTDFQSMAKEAARSRVFGGIHYNFDGTDGLQLGQKIGRIFNEQALLPVLTPSSGRFCQ